MFVFDPAPPQYVYNVLGLPDCFTLLKSPLASSYFILPLVANVVIERISAV